ncbi:DsrE family protein [bacterium]|nr:DsrE family protein [bacterium]
MGKYLFVETRDPFENRDCDSFYELVQGIAADGNQTQLFLIQNGVMPARKGSRFEEVIDKLNKSQVQIHADGFSLRERGIRGANLLKPVKVSGMEELVQWILEPDTKIVWH